MSSVSGFRGVYAVDWAQTASGEEWGLAPDLWAVGMTWRWRGEARRLDGGAASLWLEAPQDRHLTRARARERLRRLALAPIGSGDPDLGTDGPDRHDRVEFTDGRRCYAARLVQDGARRLVVFDPLLPPADRDLWISALHLAPRNAAAPAGVICFLPGTRIATPDGARAVETLEPGDTLTTRDNGAQPLLWRGETRLSGAELYLHPHLRPLRICTGALAGGRPEADLMVSPGHRLLVESRGGEEVLVAAADLEDGRQVRRDFSLSSVRYIHLMLARHEILTANGQPCESFHPGLAGRRVLDWHARSLERCLPGIVADPARYGEPARRCLSRGEAAILLGTPG